jgi:hypothetical protein
MFQLNESGARGMRAPLQQHRELSTGFASIGTVTAHLRALFATVLRPFVAEGRTVATQLLAQHANIGGERRFLLVQRGTGQTHVMTRLAQFGAVGTILFATDDATLACRRALTALFRAIDFPLLVFGKQL